MGPLRYLAVAVAVGCACSLPAFAVAGEEPATPDEPAPPAPRDGFLAPARRGTWALLDAYTAGVQASLERRIVIEREDYAAITPKLTALGSLGFGEVSAHTDARFLFFGFGVSGGIRRVWRTYAFAPGIEGTRDARADIDSDKAFTTEDWGYGEARARMALPIHENVLFVGNAAARYEHCPDNSFDWLHTTMHDRGVLFRYDATVFYRSPTFGGIGPTVRAMDVPRGGRREIEAAGGFTFGRRLGFLPNDLFVANVLVRPGDPSFGFQILRAPVQALLVYRVQIPL
jgi:hypothetical protein